MGTTVDAIAAAAGVTVQTVYNAVGSKRAVPEAVHDLVVGGPEAPTPVPTFMRERSARAPDAEAVVGVIADWFAEAHPRLSPIGAVISGAAGVDADVAAYDRARSSRRYRDYHLAARELAGRGALAADIDESEAAALIWALGHPDVYRFLVEEQRWKPERYRAWVERALRDVLLERRPPRAPRRRRSSE